jgi:transcriptional regulator of acetoin/glycerol metabolism
MVRLEERQVTTTVPTIASRTRGMATGCRGSSKLPGLCDRFLADPDHTDLSALRPVIARSWMRSLASGVDPAASGVELLRDPQIDGHVIESAEPAVRKLLERVHDPRGLVTLADARGTLAALRGSVEALRWAHEHSFRVGTAMSEDLIGTNATGSALEEGEGLTVSGAEHFSTSLRNLVSISAAVRDSLRGSMRAVLSLTLPLDASDDDLTAIGALVDETAREIASVLAVQAAPREHALLIGYLRELRKRGAGAVVAIDGRTTLASQAALELLSPQDYPVLSAYAQECVRTGCGMSKDVVLASDRLATISVAPVFAGRKPVGSVLQVRVAENPLSSRALPRDAQLDPFRAFVGESRALRRALDLAGTAASRQLPVHIVGEPGSGKRMLARAIASIRAPQSICIDLAGVSRPGPDDLVGIAKALDHGDAVVLAHCDWLSPSGWELLDDLLVGRGAHPIFITARRLSEPAGSVLGRIDSLEIVMPGIDARREDVPVLVAQTLGAIAGGPRRVSARLMRLFTEATFLRNVTELREIVVRAAARCRGPELTTDDLAEEDRRALMRIALSPLQTAEAEQIREALRRAGGNRVRAAGILKIGRSTLYRRLDAYARLGFDLEAEAPGVMQRQQHARIRAQSAMAA